MSESQTLKTMVHEVAHSRLHDKEVNQSMDIPVKDRNTKEVEAGSDRNSSGRLPVMPAGR